MRWNGGSWSAVTIPGSTGSFSSVTASSAKNVWVFGATANGANAAWHIPGGTTVLAVGQVAPAPGDDESWDALVEQYG
jgi:hypothetical protein